MTVANLLTDDQGCGDNHDMTETPRCRTCDEPIHRDGFAWSHLDQDRIYGHEARLPKAKRTGHTCDIDNPIRCSACLADKATKATARSAAARKGAATRSRRRD